MQWLEVKGDPLSRLDTVTADWEGLVDGNMSNQSLTGRPNKMTRILTWGLLLVMTQFTFGAESNPPVSGRGDANVSVSVNPIKNGLRVFTVGHSFHAWVAPLLLELAQSAGISDHKIAGVMGVGGSTVLQCWDVPNAKRVEGQKKQPSENTAKNALMAGQVDVLTLSPIWMPDEGIDKFTDLGLQHNPNIRITVQEFWLPNDTYEPVYPLDVRKKPTVDHNAATIPELRKHYEAYFHDVDDYVRGVNQKFGNGAAIIVPVGQATLALREKIVAGQAPGFDTQAELFRDPWGLRWPPKIGPVVKL